MYKISSRLCSKNFNEIASFAISRDIVPLRLKCLRVAEDDREVFEMFNQHMLSPEVMFELKAIWQLSTSSVAHGRKQKSFF